jgi:site-specific recombinase XerD
VKTLKRHYLLESIPLPKEPQTLPTVLSQGEVTTLIESASNLMHRAILMTLYATGMRRAELCHLKVSDIDKEPMVDTASYCPLVHESCSKSPGS